MINYNDRIFRSVSTNGERVSDPTVFQYQQQGFLVSATYEGGGILFGHLIGLVNNEGVMDIRFHHVDQEGSLMTGTCASHPEVLEDGRIRIYESWKWTSGSENEIESVVEEIGETHE